MPDPQLKLFTDPNLLQQIQPALLYEFLAHFQDTLGQKFATLLRRDLPGLPESFQAFLNAPEAGPVLPELAAIEFLAAPENSERLHWAIQNAPLNPVTDSPAPPLQRALYLWLMKPFELPYPPGVGPGSSRDSARRTPHSKLETLRTPNSGLRTSEAPNSEVRIPKSLQLSVLLFEIEPAHKRDFFDRFITDLKAKFPDLPERAPSNEEFEDAVFALLKKPEQLPQRMLDALLAVEELASPENRQLLRGLVAQANIEAHPETPPDQLALLFWLRCPFLPGRLHHLRDQLPAEFRNLPEPGANGHTAAPLPTSGNHDSPADVAARTRFPRYKISHLPPDVREEINRLLRRRVTYAQILATIGDRAPGINKSNLSRWRKTGYLLWLAEQERREEAHSQIHLLFDLVREKENGKLHEATQQIAALRISQVLAAIDPATLIQALQQQPQSFVRLVQTLPNLSRGGMDCERLLVELAERKAALNQDTKPKRRGISEEKMQYMEEKLRLM